MASRSSKNANSLSMLQWLLHCKWCLCTDVTSTHTLQTNHCLFSCFSLSHLVPVVLCCFLSVLVPVDDKYRSITSTSAPLMPDPLADEQQEEAAAVPPPPSPPLANGYTAAGGGQSLSPQSSAYDVVLSDSVHQTKCLLHPRYSSLVERGALQPGYVIRVFDSCARYDESVIKGAGFIFIRGLTVIDNTRQALLYSPPAPPLTFTSSPNSHERLNRPLISSRAYYLSMYNDDSVDSQQIDTQAAPPPATEAVEGQAATANGTEAAEAKEQAMDEADLGDNLLTIAGVAHAVYTGHEQVIARVTAKSRIFHFASTQSGRRNASPFMFELLLQDATAGGLKATIWNNLVNQWYNEIQVDQVICFSGFRIRNRADQDELELSLNPINPTGIIKIIPTERYASLTPAIPIAPFAPIHLRDLLHVPDEQHADVLGIVTYAGRVQRDYSKTRRQFYCSRYILLTDESDTFALPVRVYTNSQEQSVFNIQTGAIIMMTNVTLETTQELQHSRDQRSLRAETSVFSQVFSVDQLMGLNNAVVATRLEQLTDWYAQQDQQQLRTRPSSWQWNAEIEHANIQRSQDLNAPGQQVYAIPIKEIQSKGEELQYAQVKSILAQGTITAIKLLPTAYSPDGSVKPVQKTKKRKTKRKEARAPVEVSASSVSALPTSAGTFPIAVVTVTDLNGEHEIQLELHNQPLPFARLGGEQTAAAKCSQEALQQLPIIIQVLLGMIPHSSLTDQQVSDMIELLVPELGVQPEQPKGRRKGRGRPPKKGVSGTKAKASPVVSSSQPLPSRPHNRELAALQQWTMLDAPSRRQRGKKRAADDLEVRSAAAPSVASSAAASSSSRPRPTVISTICKDWLIPRQVLCHVTLYRASSSVVEHNLTSMFTLEQAPADTA